MHFPKITGTIPVEFGQLVNLQKLTLEWNSLTGANVRPSIHAFCMFADIFTFAGELPKELGKLINLTHFNVAGNSIGGELYFPAYMCFADIPPFCFLQANCPKSSATSSV